MSTALEKEKKWYCLRSQPKREAVAAAYLRRELGLDVFSPRLKFQQPTVRGSQWRTESLFPNYLFARFAPWDMLRRVNSSSGISGVVHFGDKLADVREEEIQALRVHVRSDETVVIEQQLKVGDWIQVTRGPLTGMEALVTKLLPARERVKVLLEFLGNENEVELDAAIVLAPRAHPFQTREAVLP